MIIFKVNKPLLEFDWPLQKIICQKLLKLQYEHKAPKDLTASGKLLHICENAMACRQVVPASFVSQPPASYNSL